MKRHAWKQNLPTLPSVGVALLPKIACPACWPAYTGLFSSLGLGFVVAYTAYLLPLTVLFLLLTLGTLAFRARQRHGYGPSVLGAAASAFILFGKFLFLSNSIFYAGLGLLILASVWNSWPKASRYDCAPAAARLQHQAAQGEE